MVQEVWISLIAMPNCDDLCQLLQPPILPNSVWASILTYGLCCAALRGSVKEYVCA